MKIIDKELKNGIKLRILNSKEFKSSKITVKFNAGYLSESREKNQIAHVLEHIIFDYSKEDRAWLAEVGAEKNAQTWEEYTRYFIEVLPEYFEKSIDILLRAIENPKISDDIVEREIKNVRSEFTSRRQNPLSQVFDKKMEEIFPNTINDRSAIDSLQNISTSDIQRHYDEFYTTNNARVFVFGAFSEIKISKIVEKLENFKLPRGQEKSFPKIQISQNRGAKILKKDGKYHFIYLSPFENMKYNARERATFSVLRMLLTDTKTGKMYREIRDKGLLYHIFWGLQHSQNSLIYSEFSFSSDEETFEELMAVIKKWILWAENGDFSDEDISKIKLAAKNSFRMNIRSVDNRALWIRDQFLDFKGYSFEEIISEIDKISRDDIILMAKNAFAHLDEVSWL